MTVAVIHKVESTHIHLSESELSVEWYSGTGAGGQHRNKTQNCCRLTHIPTGLSVKSENRSRKVSYRNALESLTNLVSESTQKSLHSNQSAKRKQQVGSGMRGDKIRTYRFQDDIVIDHRTSRKEKLKKIMKGNFDVFWC